MPQLETDLQHSRSIASPESDSGTWYVALGVPCGRWGDPHHTEARPTATIRQGERFLVIDLDALDVFLPALRPQSRNDLIATADEAGVEDPAELVDAVIDSGLLAEFGGDPVHDLEQLGGLRLQQVGLGVGDDGPDPGNYRISTHDLRPLIDVDAVSYAVWAASDGRSLAKVCEQVGSAWQMEGDAVLRHVLVVLPKLLESGAAFLDVAPRGDAR